MVRVIPHIWQIITITLFIQHSLLYRLGCIRVPNSKTTTRPAGKLLLSGPDFTLNWGLIRDLFHVFLEMSLQVKMLSGRTTPEEQSHYIRKTCSVMASLLKEQYNRSGVRKQTNVLGEWLSVCHSAKVGSYTLHWIPILHSRHVLTIQRNQSRTKCSIITTQKWDALAHRLSENVTLQWLVWTHRSCLLTYVFSIQRTLTVTVFCGTTCRKREDRVRAGREG